MMKIDSVYDYFAASLADLALHRKECKDVDSDCEVRHAFRGDQDVIVQLWWVNVPSRVASEFMWDSVYVTGAGKAGVHELFQRLSEGGVLLSEGPIAGGNQAGSLFIPMYQYHPQRFRAVLPFAKQIAQVAQSGDIAMFTREAMEFVAHHEMHAYNDKLSTSPLRFRLKADQRTHNKLMEVGMFFGDFVEHGRQIFDFPQVLAEGFRRSDVEDIPLEAIKLPYDSFFLHFGPQKDLETTAGWHPDGAYVSRIGDPRGKHVIQFCLTSVPASQDIYEQWDCFPEPIYIQGVPDDLMGTGIGEAVDRVVSNKIAELTKQVHGSMQADIELARNKLEADGLEIPSAVIDVSGRNAKSELDRLSQLHRAWREMLNLVVNAIAYLSSYGDDVRTDWPARTPKDLLDQHTQGTPKQRQRARSKLAALGYSAVHLCGNKFVEQSKKYESSGTEPQKRPTWVRGSWVWQPHGPQSSLRRLQWRMPHVRNKDAAGKDEPLGHLYLVS